MIWVIFLLLVGLLLAFLLAPLFRNDAYTARGLEEKFSEIRAQLADIDADEADGRITPEAADQSRKALERRVLVLLDQAPEGRRSVPQLSRLALFVIPGLLVLGGTGLYTLIGTPDFERVTWAEFQVQQAEQAPQSLEELVVTLQARLEADPAPPAEGYVLLARSLMTLGRFDEGLAAYERAGGLSGEDPAIIEELARARIYAEQASRAPALDPEAIERIEQMSSEEQRVMIEGMVEGLALRLEDDPADLEGWMRLLRARMVLGQDARAREDLARARLVFSEQAEALSALDALAFQTGLVSENTD